MLHAHVSHAEAALQRALINRREQSKSYDAEKQSEGKVTEHKYQNVPVASPLGSIGWVITLRHL